MKLSKVEIDVTNQELADSVNINLYTATRIVSEWQKIGAIRKHRGKIVLRAAKKLFSLFPRPKATGQLVVRHQ